jgi:hypothetical protein
MTKTNKLNIEQNQYFIQLSIIIIIIIIFNKIWLFIFNNRINIRLNKIYF